VSLLLTSATEGCQNVTPKRRRHIGSMVFDR
jgi:hypothetical protein